MTTSPDLPKPRPAWKTPLIVLGIIVLVAVVAIVILWWWINRPITPVTLTPPEKERLELKIDALSADPPEFAIAPPNSPPVPGTPVSVESEPAYVPGSKTIILTERELNGLLEMNGLGDKVKIVLGNDAIVTRVNTDIPEDFPMMGGKKFKARARFFIKDGAGNPALIVDDVTVWGVSLPDAWLGDIKGDNLFEVISPELNDNIISRGIKDIKVGSGQITIDLAD